MGDWKKGIRIDVTHCRQIQLVVQDGFDVIGGDPPQRDGNSFEFSPLYLKTFPD
jgi:hypothetical protein